MRKLLLIIFPILAIGIVAILYFTRDVLEEKPLGGGRDQYGCLGGAGFSYDAHIQACIRLWELEGSEPARIAVEAFKPGYGLTVISVMPLKCPGCFVVELNQLDERYEVAMHDLKVENIIKQK